MDERLWPDIDAIFIAAAELTGEARAAFVADRYRGRPDLQAEVESLLAADDRASTFLEARAFPTMPEPAIGPGTVLGAFRLVDLIGEGGMATVYRAERVDGTFQQQVALKLARSATRTPRRFRAERQILAELRHPHIVTAVQETVIHTRRPEAWIGLSAEDAALLDFPAPWRKTSELSPKETVSRLSCCSAKAGAASVCSRSRAPRPPRVRAMLGALGEALRKTRARSQRCASRSIRYRGSISACCTRCGGGTLAGEEEAVRMRLFEHRDFERVGVRRGSVVPVPSGATTGPVVLRASGVDVIGGLVAEDAIGFGELARQCQQTSFGAHSSRSVSTPTPPKYGPAPCSPCVPPAASSTPSPRAADHRRDDHGPRRGAERSTS